MRSVYFPKVPCPLADKCNCKRMFGSPAGAKRQLDFPDHWQIHSVISIAHLVPYSQSADSPDPFDRTAPVPGPLEYDSDDTTDTDGEVYELEGIVNHKGTQGKRGFRYLVRWKVYGAQDDQWKKEVDLRHN
jgi:hypothetical protein